MIKTDFNIIDSIHELLNVPDVLQYVDFVRPFESDAKDYLQRKSFIVVGFQSGSADDLQKATVNINVYAADDNAGNANVALFKNVEPVLISILKDAWFDDMEIDLAMTPKTIRDMDAPGYHFTNIRLNIFYPSITT
jgi:hypothetical protein